MITRHNRYFNQGLTCLLLALLVMSGCRRATTSTSSATETSQPYADTARWYIDDRESEVDLFYVVSTNVATGMNADSIDTYLAQLTAEDCAVMQKEMAYVGGKFGDMNVYSPFYHQYTLSSLTLTEEEFLPLDDQAAREVCEAFDYYMANYNRGRRFVLCGFSQGAMHLLKLLRHMDDETYGRCVAAYVLGYRLAADDVEHPHICPATDELTPGVTISFNSVNDTTAIWHKLTDGAVTCINPVNWHTDAEPASLTIGEAEATVHVDQKRQVLIVEGLQPEQYYIAGLKDHCPVGNYHLGDLLFYSRLIAANASRRADALTSDKH